MPKKITQPLWRDRVIDFRRIPARDLQAHDGNWRQHPSLQQEALLGTLREIGIAGALLVYHSPAHDGALVTIDGHLRKALDPEQTWPCLVLDVDDAEAAYILATHDPLSAMAEANADVLARLLSEMQSGEAAVQTMLSELAEQHGVIPPEPELSGPHVQEKARGQDQWIVAIVCKDEAEQLSTLETLSAQGYQCRALIS